MFNSLHVVDKEKNIYSCQHLKWIKTFHQSYTSLNNTRSFLKTTMMNCFDPLQILSTVCMYVLWMGWYENFISRL